MLKFLNYLRGLLIAPRKTLAIIVEDPKISDQIILVIISTIVLLLLHKLVPVQQPSNTLTAQTEILIQQFLDTVSRYSLVIFIPVWFIQAALLHLISRLFSKKGTLTLLLISLGFISVVGSALFLIIKIVNLFIPLPIISTLITLWFIYLTILTINSVYSVSMKKSGSIVFIQIAITVIVFMMAMSTFVIINS